MFVSGAEAITPKYLICYSKTRPSATQPAGTSGRASTHEQIDLPSYPLPPSVYASHRSSTPGRNTSLTWTTTNFPRNPAFRSIRVMRSSADTLTDPNQDPTVTPGNYSRFLRSRRRALLSRMESGGNLNDIPGLNGPTLPPLRRRIPDPLQICRRNGCNEPVHLDPPVGHQSEYCSETHREWVFRASFLRSKFNDGSIGRHLPLGR